MNEISDFKNLGFNKQILNALEDSGFTNPTDIQLRSIPTILSGQDVLGIAQTGTGKTAAYLLPLIYTLKYAQNTTPRAIILVPTRELAVQVNAHFKALAKYTDLRVVLVFGGIGPKTQIEEIAKGTDLIIGTPGRLLDIYYSGTLILKQIKHLVLDEADRLMDMGFMPQIRKLLEVLPRKRQNLLFSATYPERVERLSEEFLEFPVKIEASPQATPKASVTQALYEVPNFETKVHLTRHLIEALEENEKAIIFVRSKVNAEKVLLALHQHKHKRSRTLHGNKGQHSRLNAIEQLRNGEIQVLIATDVAARGLDISMIQRVINFDVPLIYEDYVHRIGRTGRMHAVGSAFTMVTLPELFHIEKIEALIQQKIERRDLPPEVEPAETPFEEKQNMLREVDEQRKKMDPNFKGAFHAKKSQNKPDPKKKAWKKPGKKTSSNRKGYGLKK